MAERPDRDEAAEPDRPEPDRPEPDRPEGASESPSADAWSDAVDQPHDGPQDSHTGPADPFEGPTERPRMGFSSGASGGSREPARRDPWESDDDDDDDGDFGELGAMFQQLLGGGGQGMPDLGELVRQLGGAGGGQGGQLPDIEALMRQLGGDRGMAGAGDAIQQMWKQMGIDPTDSGVMAMLQNQMKQMFGASTPEARMEMSTDVARKTVASESDPTVTAAQQREVDDAVHVANLWIDPVTTLPAPSGKGLAWSRAEWVEATMPTWHRLVEPVSEGVTAAMTKAMDEQFERLKNEGLSGLTEGVEGLPEGFPNLSGLDLGNLIGQIQPAVRQMAGSMFSAQLGHGVGALAADLLSATEVGLPLLDGEDVALLPANVAAFTEGLGIDDGEVRLYLAVREAARARLFAQVPWLGPQLEAAVRDYARNITIDTDAIEEQVRDMDLQNPAGIQEALRDKLFSPTPTAEQRAALDRLETSLALVEGWVDLVTEQATTGHLPNADALGEAVRRRRVSGPAQKTFSGLVGLELRPRRLKDAKNLWAALENAGGADFRDAPWEHPDIAPTGADLDDPLGYVEKRRDAASSDDVDSALDALLRDDGGDAPDAGPGPTREG